MSTTFAQEQSDWKRSRPAWKSLLAAVKSDAPADELSKLADAAGATGNELSDLRTVRNRAKRDVSFAKQYPAAQKKLDSMDVEIDKTRKQAEGASAHERPRILASLGELARVRDLFFRGDFLTAKTAHDFIEKSARPLGLV